MTQVPLFDTLPPVTAPIPTQPKQYISTSDILNCFRSGFTLVTSDYKKDKWYLEPGEYGCWDKILECGRSYMVGDKMPMAEYRRSHSSNLSEWQKNAFAYVCQNEDMILFVETRTHHWKVYKRGEYVEFALPHQDYGGERHYVTINGKTKILINED